MSSDVIKVDDLLRALLKHAWVFLLFLMLGIALAFVAIKATPKQYKAKSVISIQSSYFENPLVSDLIPGVSDPSELNARRSALLRLSLNDTFINQLGEEFNLFKSKPDEKLRLKERENLFEQIAFFSLSSSTYQVSMIAKTPDAAYQILQRVVDQMINTLIGERYGLLAHTRDSIKSQIETLGLKLRDLSGPAATLDPEGLRIQLEKINKDLVALLVNYTEKHPEVLKLKEQALSIESLLANQNPTTPGDDNADSGLVGYLPPSARQPIEEVYNELLKKLNYLNVILDVERDREKISHVGIIEQPVVPASAFFPNPKVFLSVGAASGLALALILVIFFEMRKGTFVSTEQLEVKLDIPFFGELPALENSKKILLLPSPASVRRALPWSGSKQNQA